MKIAIIGAGFGGMAAAYDLRQAGHEVTIYESAGYVGGLASGFKEPHWDWTMEKFYHHWFQSDKDVLGLIDEIGARDQVLFPRPITAIYYQGRFHPFDSMFTNMPLFLLRHFPLTDVIRFGLAGAQLKFRANWQALEQVTADQWLREHMGPRVYEALWKPLLVGKFSESYADVNMAWMWARIHARTTRLGTFVGGFQAFFETLAAAVQQRGATLHLATAVREIAPQDGGGFTVHTPHGAVAYDAAASSKRSARRSASPSTRCAIAAPSRIETARRAASSAPARSPAFIRARARLSCVSMRPGAICSSVAICFASTAGLRKNGGVTSVPSCTRCVMAATAVSSVHASRIAFAGEGTP